MVITSKILERYRAMVDLSQKMLHAAKQKDWDQLIDMENTRSSIEQELRLTDTMSWPSMDGKNKAGLILTISKLDAETKLLVELGKQELLDRLSSVGTEKKLVKAYNLL